jgi:hypothetical protein
MREAIRRLDEFNVRSGAKRKRWQLTLAREEMSAVLEVFATKQNEGATSDALVPLP